MMSFVCYYFCTRCQCKTIKHGRGIPTDPCGVRQSAGDRETSESCVGTGRRRAG